MLEKIRQQAVGIDIDAKIIYVALPDQAIVHVASWLGLSPAPHNSGKKKRNASRGKLRAAVAGDSAKPAQ